MSRKTNSSCKVVDVFYDGRNWHNEQIGPLIPSLYGSMDVLAIPESKIKSQSVPNNEYWTKSKSILSSELTADLIINHTHNGKNHQKKPFIPLCWLSEAWILKNHDIRKLHLVCDTQWVELLHKGLIYSFEII